MQTDEKQRRAVNDEVVAKALGISISAVRHDRTGARRIPFYRFGTRVLYDLDRVFEALAAHEVGGNVKPQRTLSKAQRAPR